MLTLSVKIIATPLEETGESDDNEAKIRDLNDRPIYRAAIAAKVDCILTGDKDFLDSGITQPKNDDSGRVRGNSIELLIVSRRKDVYP